MAITFNNTIYGPNRVGEDDGAPKNTYLVDETNANTITVNGTVTNVGDPVTVTGLLPGSDATMNTKTTNTLYVTQFDNAGMIQFSTDTPANQSDTSFRFVFSNTDLAARQRVTFDSDPALAEYQTPCFVRGTLIRTTRGDVAVQDLEIGDIVVTASGAHRPIRWLGTRSYIGRFANTNVAVLPICFKAGSLGDGLPTRDLWISPKHAMFIDGALVPAEHLVNGVSVIKATRVDRVDYHHVELESHDVLVAEGAHSESFVDDAGRQIFQNAEQHAALYPDAVGTDAVYCAPRLEHGHALETIRRRIEALAGIAVDASAAA